MPCLRDQPRLARSERSVASFDVLIAGAGPAGCATALSLANFAPNLRVGLVDGSVAGHARIGEAVPPPIRPVLVHLGVWDAFIAAGHCLPIALWRHGEILGLRATSSYSTPSRRAGGSIGRSSMPCWFRPRRLAARCTSEVRLSHSPIMNLGGAFRSPTGWHILRGLWWTRRGAQR